ncbi:outer membrane beta-barrel family protein [Pedobacter duraquae]|uniref:Outer membrane receptor protein involved in Fe transport n=1 Tax=Pedobacter duraquae TaxID=425511 RepID=A0A4R6ISA4_9SPHI|nr:outer membrane beta-barrel family protein [Pedobacter duraquae]TDO24846.1 outer membrane receptor protein involved in Fe transport [Pedobacter duraquae]
MNTPKRLLLLVLTTLLIVLLTTPSKAQTKSVKGTVVEKINSKPLPYASVVLMHLPDSAKTALTITNDKGQYGFEAVKPGSYMVRVIAVGFQSKRSPMFEVAGTAINLDPISMSESVNQLAEVSVTTRVPVVDYKSDRTVIDVEKMNTAGDNGLEVISKAPGIKLDKDDNILLKGKGGINVMIDGKMTYMSGSELSTYLKSLPGSVLSKIELISNPPASFDAAGSGGIINIKLKRIKMQGTNGNITLGAGYGKYAKANGGINLNYNYGKLSSYVRLNASRYNSFNRLHLNRTIGAEQYNQLNYWHPEGISNNYSAGADYFINDKHTVGFMFKGFTDPEDVLTTSNSVNYNAAGVKAGGVNMVNPQKNHTGNRAVNLNYRFKIDTAGRELGVDADYVYYDNTKNEQFTNTYFNAADAVTGNPIDLRNYGLGKVSIYAFKMDYVHPFSQTLKMETGLKTSFVDAKSDVRFDSLKTAGWITDPNRTNLFKYRENINAGYVSLSKTIGSLDLKAGLRAEQTIGKGNSSGTNTVIDRNYWKLFPSIFATWKVDSLNQLNSSYSRRINRPSYSSLNPFAFYSDPYTAIQGNQMLQPSFSNSYELNYTYKNFRVLNLSYSTVNEVVANVIYQNDVTKASVTIPENLAKATSIYISTGSPFDLTKWWNTNNDLTAGYDRTQSNVQGTSYDAGKWTWGISSDNNFTLPKAYVLGIYAYYNAPSVSGLYKVYSNSGVNIAAKKTFANKNAVLSLKVSDIFRKSSYRSVLQYNNVNTFWHNEWESRRISLNFSYKFGNMKIKTARSRRTGTAEEEGRVGQ